jgi:hypothetical protein
MSSTLLEYILSLLNVALDIVPSTAKYILPPFESIAESSS